ncbi:MAG: hypothetical protein Q9227_008493 [Pyrenula ochraceoflavens]
MSFFLSRDTTVPSLFPTFLLPSIPFRRRRRNPSTDSTDTTTSTLSSTSTSSSPTKYLNGHTSHLRCARCATDLCLTSQIISKGFTGRHGRAYLVSGSNSLSLPHSRTPAAASATGVSVLPNTYTHKSVPRQLVTGAHTVSDISCAFCGSILGWKYVAAEEESQKYKVGKFILETKRVRGVSCWENPTGNSAEDWNDSMTGPATALPFDVTGDMPLPPDRMPGGSEGGSMEDIEFDSEDEEECEDLFAGVWSPALAAKRRRGRIGAFGRNGGNRARSEG